MKKNPQRIEKVRRLLNEALTGVETYLQDWPTAPKDFTTEPELHLFATKLQEMRESLDKAEIIPILGLWRIMETWPYKNELREKIVEAEYEYERLNRTRTRQP